MAKTSAKSKKSAGKSGKKAPSAAQLAAREKFKAMVAAKKNGGSKASKSTKKAAKKSRSKPMKAERQTKAASLPTLRVKPIEKPAYDATQSDAKREQRKIRKFKEVIDVRGAFGTVWM